MNPDEIEEFAVLGQEVLENGIEIFFRKEDVRKMFAAIVAANITAYALLKTPRFIRKTKAEVKRLRLEQEQKTEGK